MSPKSRGSLEVSQWRKEIRDWRKLRCDALAQQWKVTRRLSWRCQFGRWLRVKASVVWQTLSVPFRIGNVSILDGYVKTCDKIHKFNHLEYAKRFLLVVFPNYLGSNFLQVYMGSQCPCSLSLASWLQSAAQMAQIQPMVFNFGSFQNLWGLNDVILCHMTKNAKWCLDVQPKFLMTLGDQLFLELHHPTLIFPFEGTSWASARSTNSSTLLHTFKAGIGGFYQRRFPKARRMQSWKQKNKEMLGLWMKLGFEVDVSN